MASIDRQSAERRARLKYEFARLRRAFWGFAPSLAIVAIAVSLGQRPQVAMAFGLAMFVLGVGLLWYGRDVRRAVLPGLAMGLVPLTFALCAGYFGRMCTGDRCMIICVRACAAGGLVAGLGVAAIGYRY